ncbi:MAG TPA: Gfo/Idh/MocA family oxidoreductase [Candidatus Didemnitutus sp.]|nr:Gfo/Idh/MocA family oxidoreductase [Candidatus Didemnitutus sp.]
MANTLNWGILTTGGIARKFATDLPRSRTGRLVAVGSRNRESAEIFAREFGGVRAHGSYEALLADPEVHAVYVAPPHPWHLEWAVKAAEAGKHILCEKPLAMRRADAEKIIAAARRHRVFLMEAFMYRCHPQTAALADLVRRGAIGELRLIRSAFSVICPFDPQHRMFKRELGGGAILDLGCYPVTFSRLIAGAAIGKPFAEPVALRATGRRHATAGTDEYASAVVEYPGGVVAELSCGSTVLTDISARIYGTTGWIDVPVPFFPGLLGRDEKIVIHRPDGSREERVFPSQGVPLYGWEADAVGGAVASGALEAAAMSHADTLGTAAMLDAWIEAVGVDYTGV